MGYVWYPVAPEPVAALTGDDGPADDGVARLTVPASRRATLTETGHAG